MTEDEEDEEPVVRSYALTRGRVAGEIDLTAIVAATGIEPSHRVNLSLEHRRLLALAGVARPLADVASDSNLPIGVVRVLISDLVEHQMIEIRPSMRGVTEGLLREVINGLRAL
ncbi:DUF742 domain-containing protein [Streptosporangiaceae bacterium NEAU-GS5]|nr:DUF742 domain-containing protein [Streptosporangiaceae bacterium NEAU-GS5]